MRAIIPRDGFGSLAACVVRSSGGTLRHACSMTLQKEVGSICNYGDIPVNSYSEPTYQTRRRWLQGMTSLWEERWCSEAFLRQKCRQGGDGVVLAAGCQNGLLRDICGTELQCRYFENIVGFSVKTTQWCIKNLVKFRKRVESKQEDYYKTLWTCNIPTSWLQLEVWWFYPWIQKN